MWKWEGKPQSKRYMVRLGNPIFQGDPLFFILLYFTWFLTIFSDFFHDWLSQPVHGAVQCVVCCSVAPLRKEGIFKQMSDEITFLTPSFSSAVAVKSAMPIFLYRTCFHSLNVTRMQKIQSLSLTILDCQEPRFGFLKSCFVRGLTNGRPRETFTLSDLWGTDKSDLFCKQLNLVLKEFNVKCQY